MYAYSHLGVRCEDDGGRTCVFEAELCSRGHTSLEAVWEETSDGQKASWRWYCMTLNGRQQVHVKTLTCTSLLSIFFSPYKLLAPHRTVDFIKTSAIKF